MSTSKHTPGPWIAEVDDNGENLGIMSEAGKAVVAGCGCCGSPWSDKTHAHANARLIAAAPELLEALKMVLQHGRIDNSEKRMNVVSAAIAKAEGRG